MTKSDITDKLAEVASKYDNLEVKSSQYDEETGQLTMTLGVTGGPQPDYLPREVQKVSVADLIAENPVFPVNYTSAARRYIQRDPLSRGDLDLAKPLITQQDPQELYRRSIEYSRSKDVYGSHINILTNFASKGFENDTDDENIKNFFDFWTIDVGFDDIVEKIFYDFFRVGMVRTYKVMGNYEPKISYLSLPGGIKPEAAAKYSDAALRGNRFTSKRIPIAYTILNPTEVLIKGTLMFGQTATFLKSGAGEEIKKMLELPKSQLSTFQKKVLNSLPADFKKAVENNQDIPLDPDLIGEVDYRRMPYERYPLPRAGRAFESIEFKDELRKADYSTLDGITNYILLIRVGNDEHPVSSQDTLDRAAELFDTVSKSFNVVWNHTMDVQKITSPEIGEVLGQDKYNQVNEDLTGALGLPRALIDGLGQSNAAAVELATKAVIEEINYARRQVSRWIYKEYRAIAETMGFDRIPKVRFDDMALRDEIQMMTIVQGMIDRRIISYRTGQKKLGFDPDTELAQMKVEKPLVEEGVLGIVGSPFQQSGRQTTQGTPKGTPSEGRPRGRPTSTPKDSDDNTSGDPGNRSQAKVDEFAQALSSLSLEDLEALMEIKKQQDDSDKPENPEGDS